MVKGIGGNIVVLNKINTIKAQQDMKDNMKKIAEKRKKEFQKFGKDLQNIITERDKLELLKKKKPGEGEVSDVSIYDRYGKPVIIL
jgi:translation initiation factor IF-2